MISMQVQVASGAEGTRSERIFSARRVSLVSTGFIICMVVLSACSTFAERACTLIGCDDGLHVTVVDPPDGFWTLEVEEGDGAVHRHTCTGDVSCEGIFFRGVTSATITVRVINDDDTREWTLSPDYERLQPNGPGCPPTCRQGMVEVRL